METDVVGSDRHEPSAEAVLTDELVPESEFRQVSISVHSHGERLDRALARDLPEFSRSYLQQLMQEGGVLLLDRPIAMQGVNPSHGGDSATRSGPALKPSTKVRAGQVFRIELRPTLQSQAFVPQDMPLRIVFEDEHLRVIDKPSGLVVHPAPGHWSGTLLNGLLALDPGAALLPRAGIVHRLDKDTSGLMLVARTRACMDRLVAQIAAREVHREYLALAHGAWRGSQIREVDAPVGRDPAQRLRMAVVDLQQHPGKEARTTFQCLDSTDEACWVHCRLHTGRTHQIRVHLAHIGHRLVGDSLYGGRPVSGLERQGLHAFRLSLFHPITGAWLSCHSEPPPDLVAGLQTLGLRYNQQQLPAIA